MKTHTVLYSGGLDSFLTLNHLKTFTDDTRNNMTLLYFNLGAKCNNSEIELFNSANFKRYVSEHVHISDCLNMGNLEDAHAYIPNRNILAAIMAHSITNSDYIWIGGTKSDRVNDNNSRVCTDLSNMLTYMHDKEITVDSAFYDFHKCELVKEFTETKGWGNYESNTEAKHALIYSTFSCYNPCFCKKTVTAVIDDDDYKEIVTYDTKECLTCPACFRKNMSLYAGGIFIPMKITDSSKSMIKKYYDEAVENIDDENMKPRYEATISYVDALKERLNLEF